MSLQQVLQKLGDVQAEQAALREQHTSSQSTLSTVCTSLDKLTSLVEDLCARLDRLEERLPPAPSVTDDVQGSTDTALAMMTSPTPHAQLAFSELPDGDDGLPLYAAEEAGHILQATANTEAVPFGLCLHCGLQCTGRVCSSCSVAVYCGRSCQRADWKSSHKFICGQLGAVSAELHQLRQQLRAGAAATRGSPDVLEALQRATSGLDAGRADKLVAWLQIRFGVDLQRERTESGSSLEQMGIKQTRRC